MEFKTPKGTILPLLDLRGKPYLQAAHRLVWFREEHPDWTIETTLVRLGQTDCVAQATVKDSSGRIMATAHKSEDQKGFRDFIEKSETGAIARALAMCGFGTQFAPEFDEGERLADSPVMPATTEYKFSFGKYNGKYLWEIDKDELQSYVSFIEKALSESKKSPDAKTVSMINAINNHLKG